MTLALVNGSQICVYQSDNLEPIHSKFVIVYNKLLKALSKSIINLPSLIFESLLLSLIWEEEEEESLSPIWGQLW